MWAILKPPVFLPSIGEMAGGEVPTWKMQSQKSKPKPCDQDAHEAVSDKDAKKGRKFTQAVWKDKIKEAKGR